MKSKIITWCITPDFLVALTALLTALIVQPGEVGSVDTARRLQVAHSFWTSAPPFAETDDPTFGIPGRNGRLEPGYGIGQSLLLLPADIISTWLVAGVPALSAHGGLRKVIVAYTVSPIVCTLAVLVSFRFLRRLGFVVNHAVAGALTLLFATTFLHYTQNMMENNLLFLLTLLGMSLQYAWLRTGSVASVFLGALCFGANLLTRLTTVFDLSAGALFVVVLLWLEGLRGRRLGRKLFQYGMVCLPCYMLFVAGDRLYQYYRFGTWFDTYLQVAAEHYKHLNPALPAEFPFNTPFWQGFLGPLVTPEKCIFLFDPLLVLLGILVLTRWKSAFPAVKAYVFSMVTLLFAYLCFYAKFIFWSGDVAWGDRYLSTPVQLLALVSVPLLLEWRRRLPVTLWRAGIAIVMVSTVIQIGSVALWYPLEFCQMRTAVGHTFVIGLRFKNIAALALDTMDRWQLTNEFTAVNGYRCNTPYFYPFLVRKRRSAPAWIADALLVFWTTLVTILVWTLHAIRLRTKNLAWGSNG